MDTSIIISDGVLSSVAFYIAFQLFRSKQSFAKVAATGILIIGLTSFIGFINHFGVHEAAPFGKFFGGLSNFLGVPLIGLAFAMLVLKNKKLSSLLISLFLTIYIVFTYFYSLPTFPMILGSISMITIIAVSISKIRENSTFSTVGIIGATLIIIAGLVIGTEGKIGSFLRLDLYHYMIAGALVCFGNGLVTISPQQKTSN